MTKFLNISTDRTLGGSTPSDSTVSSQKAIKNYIADNVPMNTATGTDGVSLFGTSSSGNYATNIGYSSSSGTEGVALGYFASAKTTSVSVGSRSGNDSNKINFVCVGYQATVGESDTVCIGYTSLVNSQYGVAIGDTAYVLANSTGSIAIGYSTSIESQNAVAIGYDASVSGYGYGAVAIGYSASATGVGSIQLGHGTNTENQSLYVGFGAANEQYSVNYKLLGSTGLIPIERLGGDNTSTNAKFLKENGTWAEVGGGVSTDGISITTNSSDEIQTIGVIDQNNTTNAIKTWTGTKAQYDAITTKDANTVYNITDDTNPTQALLETIYPVGSIYIGTMNICPLSALFGTWELVAQDKVLQGAGNRGGVGATLNESLPNITGSLGSTWYSFGGTRSGAFKATSGTVNNPSNTGAGSGNYITDFDASLSSSTYQDNAPVQQDAYLVNIWQRTA